MKWTETADDQCQDYAELTERLNEVAIMLEEPQSRRDFIALCEEYDRLMTELENLTEKK